MKIALVHMRHAHTGGTERYLNLLAMELAEHGHQVDIVCRSHEALDHPNIHFVTLKPMAVGKAHRMWRFAKAVERHIDRSSYDLVYGLGKTWSQDLIRIGGGSHKRYLQRMSEKQRLTLKDRVSMALEARAFAAGNYRLVIANSHMCAGEISEDFQIPRDRIEVIHNSVPLERFQQGDLVDRGVALRRELGIAEDVLLYLFLATGYRRKGLDRLLQSFQSIVRQDSDARLLVVGYDSQQNAYQQMAADLGIAGQVVFAGGRRDTEVCYAAADIYVLPTRYDPFANTTLEALAAGLPVITTSSNGGSEVLESDFGDVVPPCDDPEPLSLAMARWSDPELRQNAGRKAREQAARYNHQQVMGRTRELLERLAITPSEQSERS